MTQVASGFRVEDSTQTSIMGGKHCKKCDGDWRGEGHTASGQSRMNRVYGALMCAKVYVLAQMLSLCEALLY